MLSGEDRNKSYEFHSPGYPNGYERHLNCVWIFETVAQNHIFIEFQDINIEQSWQCSADSVNIYSGECLLCTIVSTKLKIQVNKNMTY